ncbi:transcription factor bHLH95 [Cajanus cajan]|uniref:Transcription factor bHLH95 n=1 Tax=Cajanus cajan TaxID=3821 RepID=A0A151RSS4_CAJCA|nr:transcription factor bHLH95 [Cajanus cajan]KYP45583.1 Transcription factor bHLH95 [Cajanus cajan]
MALALGNQGPHDITFLWEDHSWDPTNSDNSSESKEKAKPLNQQKEEKDETLVNKKRNQVQRSITSGEGKDEKCQSDHEVHIWTERERRKKMRNMFANLHALLPHIPSKADKSTVVDEAVSYIKNLQQTLEKLEKQKQERVQYVSTFGCDSSMFVTHQGSSNNPNAMMGTSNSALSFPGQQQPIAFEKTWAASNIVLNICGDEAQFTICAARKPGLLTSIAFVLDKYKIEVICANISSIGNGNGCMIQAHGKRSSNEFLDANSVEEIYKQVAGEIMLWIA